jgi:hypothetical protein
MNFVIKHTLKGKLSFFTSVNQLDVSKIGPFTKYIRLFPIIDSEYTYGVKFNYDNKEYKVKYKSLSDILEDENNIMAKKERLKVAHEHIFRSIF